MSTDLIHQRKALKTTKQDQLEREADKDKVIDAIITKGLTRTAAASELGMTVSRVSTLYREALDDYKNMNLARVDVWVSEEFLKFEKLERKVWQMLDATDMTNPRNYKVLDACVRNYIQLVLARVKLMAAMYPEGGGDEAIKKIFVQIGVIVSQWVPPDELERVIGQVQRISQ